MRRWWIAFVVAFVVGLAGPAQAQTALDKAAQSLRNDPVYVDPGAEQTITSGAAADLRARIRNGGSPVFVAVLPASAAADAGGDPNQVPAALAKQVGLRGTYGVVVGKSFRAGSNALPTGRAGTLATAAFQAKSGEGTAAVLDDFIGRVLATPVSNGAVDGNSAGNGTNSGTASAQSSGGGGVSSGTVIALVLLGLGGGGLFFWFRKRRLAREKEAAETEAAERRQLEAELSVLSDDVIALESEVTLHPEAREDYDAGVSRHQAAVAAMGHTGDKVDLVRVGRVIEEGRYAMNRARARIDGREPPPPAASAHPTRPPQRACDRSRRPGCSPVRRVHRALLRRRGVVRRRRWGSVHRPAARSDDGRRLGIRLRRWLLRRP